MCSARDPFAFPEVKLKIRIAKTIPARALLGPKVGSAIGTLATCTQLARNLATLAPPTIPRQLCGLATLL